MTVDAPEVLAIVRVLDMAGIRYVVSGGWGVDALLGRQTRPHADLDLGVDAARIDEVVELLTARGYELALDQRPARLELHAAGGRLVDLHPITWDAQGNGRQQGFEGRIFEYPAADIVSGKVGGAEVRCISAELQLDFHTGYEPQETDRRDVAALTGAGLRRS